MHNHSYENEFNLQVNEISLSYERMGTKTRFEKEAKAGIKRRTSHDPNPMLMRENKGFFAFAFDSAHVKYGV